MARHSRLVQGRRRSGRPALARSQRALGLSGWDGAKLLLMEFQPAKSVVAIGDPPRGIRVVSHGKQPDVAPGLPADVEERVGTRLRIV